jgi:ligand-binding SRPBCC domain-containing protein
MFRGNFLFKTKLSIKKEVAWLFFNDIHNLVRITSFPRITIIKNEGTKKDSITELDLDFFLFQKKWVLTYVDVKEGDYFIDRSDSVPFPLKSWQHTHLFESVGGETMMIDKVKFESYAPVFLVKLFLYFMFKGRQRALRKHLPM